MSSPPLPPPSSPPQPWSIRQTLGPLTLSTHGYTYKVLKKLGQGSFGSVNLCKRVTSLEESVEDDGGFEGLYAVKVVKVGDGPKVLFQGAGFAVDNDQEDDDDLPPPMSSSFITAPPNDDHMPSPPSSSFTHVTTTSSSHESLIHSSLNHPNITLLYELITSLNTIQLVLEYSPLGPLNSQSPLIRNQSPIIYKTIIPGLISALEYLKSKSIAHRDIKPDNILLSGYWNPRISDLGTSKNIFSNPRTSEIIGTVSYLSPEETKVIFGENEEYDVFGGDLWSAGLSLLSCVNEEVEGFLEGESDFVGVCGKVRNICFVLEDVILTINFL